MLKVSGVLANRERCVAAEAKSKERIILRGKRWKDHRVFERLGAAEAIQLKIFPGSGRTPVDTKVITDLWTEEKRAAHSQGLSIENLASSVAIQAQEIGRASCRE